VFSLPAALGPVALCNPRCVYGLLMRAVAKTLLQVAADPKHLGAEFGILAVLHTWGQSLTLHPHVHCVVTGGGLAPGGSHWVAGRPGPDRFRPGLAAGPRRGGDPDAGLPPVRLWPDGRGRGVPADAPGRGNRGGPGTVSDPGQLMSPGEPVAQRPASHDVTARSVNNRLREAASGFPRVATPTDRIPAPRRRREDHPSHAEPPYRGTPRAATG
jgi:hypothetical protein